MNESEIEKELDDDAEDGWVNYIRRNLQHSASHEVPFPDSSWSYTRHDSPFEEEDKLLNKKSDGAIQEEVNQELYRNGEIDASHISPLVFNGIVSLFGYVDSDFARREAERIVRRIPEVWNVRNDLKIEEPH